PGLPGHDAAPDPAAAQRGRALRLRERDDLRGRAPGREGGGGPDRLLGAGAGHLEDVGPDHHRGLGPRHLVGCPGPGASPPPGRLTVRGIDLTHNAKDPGPWPGVLLSPWGGSVDQVSTVARAARLRALSTSRPPAATRTTAMRAIGRLLDEPVRGSVATVAPPMLMTIDTPQAVSVAGPAVNPA